MIPYLRMDMQVTTISVEVPHFIYENKMDYRKFYR